MFSVYVLQSVIGNGRYVGSCTDVVQRLGQHNLGISRSTRAGRPWKLVYQETFATRAEAVRRERYLKTGRGREDLAQILATRTIG